ncbi:Uncharacterised protein [Klebsiella pneumoniae]|nr:Uncharacterised protein [Klebsiella pneumoniae]
MTASTPCTARVTAWRSVTSAMMRVVANGLRSSPTTSWAAANAPKIARPMRPELPVNRIFIESIHSKRPGTTGMLRF